MVRAHVLGPAGEFELELPRSEMPTDLRQRLCWRRIALQGADLEFVLGHDDVRIVYRSGQLKKRKSWLSHRFVLFFSYKRKRACACGVGGRT